ncbi:HFL073Wp [Eremothecium sinecaudum]|uniref:HFL073Wp n=1 Tax=Eremothecium sinecaudum TaxID=45286 RepID=A0A109V0E5_9SACH|nr:HFL073Wp [Eremothecium sinecaudum]AMD21783.1 HFL073Wp [Eremothecium sinecaudum]
MYATQMKLFLKPSTTGLSSVMRRGLSTVKTSSEKAQEILIAQRKNRPVSPHLTIYQPQLTWYLSSVHRISGVILAGGFYAATIAFGASALLDLGLTAENFTHWYNNHMPVWADYTIKGSAAYLFAFHLGNGVRHLIWDTGRELTLKGVYRTGYAVLAFTAAAGTLFMFW